MNGFSAHADKDELMRALLPLKPAADRTFVIHGEPDQSDALVGALRQEGFRDVGSPEPGADVVFG